MRVYIVATDLAQPNAYADAGLEELCEYLQKWAAFDLYLHEHEAPDELADKQDSG